MKRSDGIVVDADVARASADLSESRRALACARSMTAILESGALCIAFDERLQGEWRDHSGRFARKWLTSMYARRRVRSHGTVPKWATLRSAIVALSPRSREAAEKDLHLVELARHDGWRIVSLDGKARRAFVQTCKGCVELRPLAWVDPTLAEALRWLADGARKAGSRLGDDLPASPPSRDRVTRRSSARRPA